MPSTIIVDDEVKNFGQALLSLRQTTLPLLASRQERTPRTPSVQTLPPATAGVLRGPGCFAAGPAAGCVAYMSFHTSLPLVASRQRMTSSPPCRPMTKILSPTITGDD